jgi:hypothetical protein
MAVSTNDMSFVLFALVRLFPSGFFMLITIISEHTQGKVNKYFKER